MVRWGENYRSSGKCGLIELASGESVECRIVIGERRIIDYLIELCWKGANEALREQKITIVSQLKYSVFKLQAFV